MDGRNPRRRRCRARVNGFCAAFRLLTRETKPYCGRIYPPPLRVRASVAFGRVNQRTTTLLERMIRRRMCKHCHKKQIQTLSAMDVLAPTSMKNAAKCDTSCELQNQRVIKTLNAPCTSFGEYVCWSVYSSPPQIDSSNCADDRILRI